MISLFRNLDHYTDDLSDSALKALRSSLLAMARCGERAVPPLGPALNRKLTEITRSLVERATPDIVNSARLRVEEELSIWADLALHDREQAEREIREIVGAVTRAVESVTQRNDKYSGQFEELTSRLNAISEMNHLPTIRRSIVESAGALQTCFEQMARENRASVEELSNQVEEYRTRLSESERVSAEDPLTGLANRRAFEQSLESWVAKRSIFNLILIDLDEFKGVNDRYGHLAGDELLKQFAGELKIQFKPEDLVTRWGGDEFAAMVPGGRKEAENRVEAVRKWALGVYKLSVGGSLVRVRIGASIGVTPWNGSESGQDLLARADAAVYGEKLQLGRAVPAGLPTEAESTPGI